MRAQGPDPVLKDDERIVRKLAPSPDDVRTLAGLAVDPATIADDGFDYSKTVVRKPWGYEYLIFENDVVAIWILHIDEGFETSLHCHPAKRTSVTVLAGEARCSVLEGDVVRRAGDSLLIGRGVFHRTRSTSPGGTVVMEVESPVNKRDLVRFKDHYGREGMGYERADHFSFNLQNYNYASFIDGAVYYNATKRFGSTSIQLVECRSREELQDLIAAREWTALTLLRGRLTVAGLDHSLTPGDVVAHATLRQAADVAVEERIEALILNHAETRTRLSDFVIAHLRSQGLKDLFFVPGTTNAHLIDAAGRDTEVRSLALQTEHGATLAAEGYAKLTGRPAVVLLSSDPAATQALAGVANCWVDSTPMLVVSGQPRPSDLGGPLPEGGLASADSRTEGGESRVRAPRQLANKELDVVSLVRTMTKHAATVRDARDIRRALDEAHAASTEGRCGPAWLDVPIDLLGTNIDESELADAAASDVAPSVVGHPFRGAGTSDVAPLKGRPTNLEAHAEPIVGHPFRGAWASDLAPLKGRPTNVNDEAHAEPVVGHPFRGAGTSDVAPLKGRPTNLESHLAPLKGRPTNATNAASAIDLTESVGETIARLAASERPVLLAGWGIRAADALPEFLELADRLALPVLTSRRGADLIAADHPLFFGRPGTYGQRAANFVVQNADLLISIGSRLSLPLIGRNYRAFARAATKIVVDVDGAELEKPTIGVDLPICATASDFIRALLCRLPATQPDRTAWLKRCRLWGERYPVARPPGPSDRVDPYRFVEALSDRLDADDVIVVDGGPSLDYVMQSFKVKAGQRVISSPGLEHRGFALPAAIGAALASRRRVICLCEKKGLQVAMPELQTIVNHALPIKAFIFNGHGDGGVRQVQAAYFGARYVGLDGDGVVGSLNVEKLGEAYHIPTSLLANEEGLRGRVTEVLAAAGPMLTSIAVPDDQEVTPRMSFTVTADGQWRSRPLEDMYPLLDREELRDNMIVGLVEDE